MGPWACLKIGYLPNPLVVQFIPLVFPFKFHGLSCFIIIFLSSRPMVYHHFPHSNSHFWRVSHGIPMASRPRLPHWQVNHFSIVWYRCVSSLKFWKGWPWLRSYNKIHKRWWWLLYTITLRNDSVYPVVADFIQIYIYYIHIYMFKSLCLMWFELIDVMKCEVYKIYTHTQPTGTHSALLLHHVASKSSEIGCTQTTYIERYMYRVNFKTNAGGSTCLVQSTDRKTTSNR